MTLLVFTDLDGSLMEHETYSIEAARPALEILAQREFSLIMNSSKTSAEIESLQSKLGLANPYICENGAALMNLGDMIAGTDKMIFGQPQSQWLAQIHALRESNHYHFEGFSDWSALKLSELCGLSNAEAALAKQRQFSEPVLWHDSAAAKNRFEEQLQGLGLQLMEGGRFYSVQGKHDKAAAMNWLSEHYACDDDLVTVALGDSPNDTAMLAAADIAVVIKSPKSQGIELQGHNRVIRTERPGPAGWQDAMQEILRLHDNQLLVQSERIK